MLIKNLKKKIEKLLAFSKYLRKRNLTNRFQNYFVPNFVNFNVRKMFIEEIFVETFMLIENPKIPILKIIILIFKMSF